MFIWGTGIRKVFPKLPILTMYVLRVWQFFDELRHGDTVELKAMFAEVMAPHRLQSRIQLGVGIRDFSFSPLTTTVVLYTATCTCSLECAIKNGHL